MVDRNAVRSSGGSVPGTGNRPIEVSRVERFFEVWYRFKFLKLYNPSVSTGCLASAYSWVVGDKAVCGFLLRWNFAIKSYVRRWIGFGVVWMVYWIYFEPMFSYIRFSVSVTDKFILFEFKYPMPRIFQRRLFKPLDIECPSVTGSHFYLIFQMKVSAKRSSWFLIDVYLVSLFDFFIISENVLL